MLRRATTQLSVEGKFEPAAIEVYGNNQLATVATEKPTFGSNELPRVNVLNTLKRKELALLFLWEADRGGLELKES